MWAGPTRSNNLSTTQGAFLSKGLRLERWLVRERRGEERSRRGEEQEEKKEEEEREEEDSAARP